MDLSCIDYGIDVRRIVYSYSVLLSVLFKEETQKWSVTILIVNKLQRERGISLMIKSAWLLVVTRLEGRLNN